MFLTYVRSRNLRENGIGNVIVTRMPNIAHKYLPAFVKVHYNLHTTFLQLNK